MRIKKLELIGFKSFKDRTVIHFDEGITGIVGPNGCGKSNIVDALVWVMGEMSAKHLRGSSMEDVIFAGAEGYAPMGLAEVSLVLENDGGPFPAKYSRFSEVMITRRLHRSGESEYLINKEQARLKDIQEIFMDTGAGAKGFSIIEQGAIGKIITAKPEDRRSLIEEAAGITKFKVRKRESTRKLQATDQNLIRLQDILGEQKRQLESLQRQAQRAERYRTIKQEIQNKDLWLSTQQFSQLTTSKTELENELEQIRSIELGSASDLGQKESELERLRLDLLEREKAVEAKQIEMETRTKSVQNLETEIRELGFEAEQARRNKEMTGDIVSQYRARREALFGEEGNLEQQCSLVEGQAEESKTQFESKRSQFQTVQDRIVKADDELTEKRREMLTVSQSESHLEAKIQGLGERVSTQEEKLESDRQVCLQLQTQHGEFEERRNRLFKEMEDERQLQLAIMNDVANFEENLLIVLEQKKIKEQEVAEFKDRFNEISSRLYGLENLQTNFEGFGDGVKTVMRWQKERGAELRMQPLAEVLEVEQVYEVALQAALGQRFQVLLSSDGTPALEAASYLKSQGQGRSSFMSAEWRVTPPPNSGTLTELKAHTGVLAVGPDVARAPEGFGDLTDAILNRLVVVENIRVGLELRPQFPDLLFVTPDGDVLDADGMLTSGSQDGVDSGLLQRRREIKDLTIQKEEWAGKLALAQVALKKVEAQFVTLTEELEKARKQKNDKEVQIAGLKKDLERAETELKNAEQAVSRSQADVSKSEALLLQITEECEALKERLAEVKQKRLGLESDVERLMSELKSSREGVDVLANEVTRLQVESASRIQEATGLRSQLEIVRRSREDIDQQLDKMSMENAKSSETLTFSQLMMEEKKVQLERLIREVEQSKTEFARIRDEFEEQGQGIRELETYVYQVKSSMQEHQSKLNEASFKLEQVKMKLNYLFDQVQERYLLRLEEVAEQYADIEGDAAGFEKDLVELRSKIAKIGEVNLSAIQEYDDLIERYNFMNQQYQDLIEAKEQLRKVIERINRICSKRFKETFDQVNERFTKVFPVLFGGGEAKLILIEDEEKGEMGIDIIARPPGKKAQNVSLLSGGEKALTAVSLIFAIFLVKPSPFCLLDEVDAPLDDANVFRFNDLVKEMAKRSQIIIVTHNKHTMRVNDKLYGVTQQEKGVSKMVSVSLNEAQKVV